MGFFGFGKSRDVRFAEFAEKACRSRQSIMIGLREAYPLSLAIRDALMKAKGLDSGAAFKKASGELRLACSKCGEYNDQAKDATLMGGEGGALDQMKGVMFGGPTVAALGQGRCPGCQGTKVTATFDPNPPGGPELRRAVVESNLGRIDELLARGTDVDAIHPDDGGTSLAYASEAGLTPVVEHLLKAGAKPNQHAKGADVIPLILASAHGYTAIVRLLLIAGATPDARESNNLTALHFAAVGGHAEVVAALLAAGADPEARPEAEGWTPLFYAIEKGHERAVAALLAGGANPNNPNKDGISPLLYAATKSRQDGIPQLLRQAGEK